MVLQLVTWIILYDNGYILPYISRAVSFSSSFMSISKVVVASAILPATPILRLDVSIATTKRS